MSSDLDRRYDTTDALFGRDPERLEALGPWRPNGDDSAERQGRVEPAACRLRGR